MAKLFTSLGLMSGTSGDGVDASLITTDGKEKFDLISDYYFEYPQEIYKNIVEIKDKISEKIDLQKYALELDKFERDITFFNAKIVREIIEKSKRKFDFIGFHGQTIYHNPKEKISKQLGNGSLLAQLSDTSVVYNFRDNDIANGGQGAPLTPVYHKLLSNNLNLYPSIFLNIGGIMNTTIFKDKNKFLATDIGPGMCLIDKWIRLNSKLKFDDKGIIASKGKISVNLNYYLDTFFHFEKKYPNKKYIKSFDINDFDLSFVRGLNLEDGLATLVEYTASIIVDYYIYIQKFTKLTNYNPILILCGGGRKNKYLVKRICSNLKKFISKENPKNIIKLIDEYNVNGDFVESQAFAYLAIRSKLGLPISFPNTTDCLKPLTGGKIIFK